MSSFKIVSKLGPKELGDPTKARNLPEGQTLVLGTIFGQADGLSYRANDNDPTKPSIALTGIFEGVPVEGDVTIRSNTLFLPGAIQDIFVNGIRGDNPAPVSEAPKRGAKLDVSGNVIRLAVEIGVKKANNAVGYAYDIRLAGEPTKDNILDSMREDAMSGKSLAAPNARAQIAGPSGKKPAAGKKPGKKK